MKSKHKPLGQFLYENHNYKGSVDDFLEEIAPIIGYIVQSFSLLEEQLNSTICEQINEHGDETGAIVIYKMNFTSKVDLFNRLVRSMEIACGGELPTFKSLIDNLKKCSKLRNAVVHAEWENVNEDGYTYIKLRFDKNGMQQHYWQFTPESLKEINDLIYETYSEFDKFEEEKDHLLKNI